MIRAGQLYADDTPLEEMRDQRLKGVESRCEAGLQALLGEVGDGGWGVGGSDGSPAAGGRRGQV